MRTTQKPASRWDVLDPASILIFFLIAAAWIVVASLPDWDSFTARALARLAGYIAFVAMLVPYLHIVRRGFHTRLGRPMTFWLRLHIAFAYVAFAMVLIHSRGRANSLLTSALVWLTWIVMLSGVVGYYGQKVLYFFMPRLVPREYGRERLEPQRQLLLETAGSLLKKKEMQGCPEVIERFCKTAIERGLAPEFSLRAWLRPRLSGDEQISENWFQRSLSYADEKQKVVLRELWDLVEERRQLDLEYRLHQLGRSWLIVHGPAAWALLVLMLEHIVMSWWYGGF